MARREKVAAADTRLDVGRPGIVSNLLDELIIWLVAFLFSPWIVRERWRRHRERRSGAAVATDRAVQRAMRQLHQLNAGSVDEVSPTRPPEPGGTGRGGT